MVTNGNTSRRRLASGLLGVGLVSGLAAASLGMAGPVGASCINVFGFAIGGGGASGACQAAFGSIAIVIGPTPVNADGVFTGGSTAIAGNPSVFSFGNIAISVGGTVEQPTSTSAGQFTSTGLPLIGNVAFATAGSSATSFGIFNLGASLGGTRSSVIAAGIANSALNLGSDNVLASAGVVNNTTNLFGDGNLLGASNTPGTGLAALLPGLNVGFNILGDNNTVQSGAGLAGVIPGFPPTGGNGPLAIAGAILVNNQNFANNADLLNNNFGIELRTPFNEQGQTSTNVLAADVDQRLAADVDQRNVVRPSLNFTPGFDSKSNPRSTSGGPVLRSINQLAASAKAFTDQLGASAKAFTDQLSASAKNFNDQLAASTKKHGDSVNATGGGEAGTANTSDSDSDK